MYINIDKDRRREETYGGSREREEGGMGGMCVCERRWGGVSIRQIWIGGKSVICIEKIFHLLLFQSKTLTKRKFQSQRAQIYTSHPMAKEGENNIWGLLLRMILLIPLTLPFLPPHSIYIHPSIS